jgi:hypothetical protein
MTTDLLNRVRGEIEARLGELRPLVAEYERLLAGGQALGVTGRAPRASSPRAEQPTAPVKAGAGKAPGKRERAPRGAAQQAIVAALEHGSHTVSELVVVTAMSGANIRENVRRLLTTGTVTRARRDGKAAYALAGRAER